MTKERAERFNGLRKRTTEAEKIEGVEKKNLHRSEKEKRWKHITEKGQTKNVEMLERKEKKIIKRIVKKKGLIMKKKQ